MIQATRRSETCRLSGARSGKQAVVGHAGSNANAVAMAVRSGGGEDGRSAAFPHLAE